MAESEDLFHWKRLGLAAFALWHGIELADVDDKDASLFPVAIPDSTGKLELGMLHRPLFAGTQPKETARQPGTREVDLDRESIWISYCPAALKGRAPDRLGQFTSHHRLATPVSPWGNDQAKVRAPLARNGQSRRRSGRKQRDGSNL
jgi:hypothetical protein